MAKEAIKLDDILRIKVLGRDEDTNRVGIKAEIYEPNINIIEQCFNDKELVSLNGLGFIIQSYTFKTSYTFQNTNEVFCIIEIIFKEIDL